MTSVWFLISTVSHLEISYKGRCEYEAVILFFSLYLNIRACVWTRGDRAEFGFLPLEDGPRPSNPRYIDIYEGAKTSMLSPMLPSSCNQARCFPR